MHAFLVVDLQAEFDVPPDLVEKIVARGKEFPLRIFTKFVNPPGTLFREKMDQYACAPGDPRARLLIEPDKDDIVLEKTGYGLGTAQIEQLRARSVTEVTVAGLDTDACVLGVMFSLWDHKIDCHIDPDLCWSSAGLHDSAVQIAFKQFGR